MKLVFPNAEHPQVLLGQGINRVGSDPAANVVIDRPGILAEHCRLNVTAHGVMLEVSPGASVGVNGAPVQGLMALRLGDTVVFHGIEARLASVDAVGRRVGVGNPAMNDVGVTAVRAVPPRYVLRTVSGSGFGRTHPLSGATVIGRAADCTIRLDETGISRSHARLVPTDEGVVIEDLGSTNGTYVNGKRVLREEARVGDEIGFDTLRFRLAASQPADALLGPDERPLPGWRGWSGARKAAVVGVGLAALAVLGLALAGVRPG